MKAYETTATVEAGEIRVAGVPFSPGTEVDVIVSPKRMSGEEFRLAWEQVCGEMRKLESVQSISDEEIQAEVSEHRAGR